jgi:hypothetical protein
MSNQRGTEGMHVQMAKEKMIGDVIREDANQKLIHQEEKHGSNQQFDELGRPMNPLRRFAKWLRKVFKGY